MKFKAAMFDFDGTLTEKGQYTPPQDIADALVTLSQIMPVGICTGRQLESFEKRGLAELLKEVNEKERPRFLKNLYLFAENGAIGYDFDDQIEKFVELYRVEWPEKFIKRKELQNILDEAVREYGEVYYNMHRVVIVMRTKLHDEDERNVEEVYKLSEKIYEITLKILEKIDPAYEKFVHIGNSGIGVLVCPANADKDSAIKKFAQLLGRSRGIKFEKNFSDILCVGDSAQDGGNDFYFLNGRYGTPYSVGEILPDKHVPNLVFDEKGCRLLNSIGTLKLIKALLHK